MWLLASSFEDQKQEFVDMDGPKLFSNKNPDGAALHHKVFSWLVPQVHTITTQMKINCHVFVSRIVSFAAAALFVSTFGDVRWRDRRKGIYNSCYFTCFVDLVTLLSKYLIKSVISVIQTNGFPLSYVFNYQL